MKLKLYETEACNFIVRETTSLEYQISLALLILNHPKVSKTVNNWLLGSILSHLLSLLENYISIIISQKVIMRFVILFPPILGQPIVWPTNCLTLNINQFQLYFCYLSLLSAYHNCNSSQLCV